MNSGFEAWQLILQECGEGSSDLEIIKLQAAFNSATIVNTVGHKEDTMTAFARHLNALNVRIPQRQRYDNDALCIKFLSSINYPESLAKDAMDELKRPRDKKRFATLMQAAQPAVAAVCIKPHARPLGEFMTF